MLSDQQIAFFDTFGYLVLPGLFSAKEMEVIDREFKDVMAEDRAGQEFQGDKRHAVTACAEIRPALRAVIEDDRIYGALEQLLGPDLVWLGSDRRCRNRSIPRDPRADTVADIWSEMGSMMANHRWKRHDQPDFKNVKSVALKNGRPATQGASPVCGTPS
jgi:hypothetical protein